METADTPQSEHDSIESMKRVLQHRCEDCVAGEMLSVRTGMEGRSDGIPTYMRMYISMLLSVRPSIRVHAT